MKKVFCFLFLVVFALVACSKKDNTYTPPNPTAPAPSANSFSIQGDSFKNSSVSIRTISQQTGSYDGSQSTTINIQGSGNTADSFSNVTIGSIVFPGNGTGKGLIATGFALSFTDKKGTLFSYSSDNLTVGIVNITSYGAIGSPIVGTFTCDSLPNGRTNARVSIRNGKFSVLRVQ